MLMTTTTTPPYAIGTALDLPSGGLGYIVAAAPSTARTFTIGAGMAPDRWALTYATESHVGEVSENIAAPMVARARHVPPISETEAAALLARATQARDSIRADRMRAAEETEQRRAAMALEIDQRRPAWASSAIIAELVQDDSDSMTDYFNSVTRRTVILAWSLHDRDLFPEMRKAAATFAETAELASAPANAEHREKYSMGGGYYLKAGSRHSSGWRVSKTRVDWLKGRCDVEFPQHVTAEEVAAEQASAVQAGRFTIEAHHNDRRGFDYWLCVMGERVERAEYDALLAQAKALGGWYSRAWQGIPGGFAFKSEEKARQFAGQPGNGPDGGEQAPKAQPLKAQPSAPASSAPGVADKLREMADKLTGDIAGKFADRRMNTPKQQKQAAEARQDGCDLERAQAMARALADLHDAGAVPAVLARVTTKAAILAAAVERCDHSRGGYYDAGRPTGEPRDSDPATLALWALVAGKADPEAAKAADIAARIAKLKFAKIPGYFPTPAGLVARMIEAARLTGGESVLEPSAGSGAIADALRDLGCAVVCVEVHASLVTILRDKGHNVIHADFREFDTAGPCHMRDYGEPDQFDAVLMNPPFEKGADLEHIGRAFRYVRPGGRLVAIMGAGVQFRQDRRYSEFREWVEQLGGEFEEIPAGTFKESGTGVASVMLTIDRES